MNTLVSNRPRVRHLALLLAAITAAGFVGLASTSLHLFGSIAFMVLALLTIDRPSFLPVLIGGGQVTAAAVLLSLDGTERWMLLPGLITLVASAELIAVLARIGGPVPRETGLELHRALQSAAVGGAVCAAVLLVGSPPALGGSLGAALVLGTVALLAWVVLREE